MLISTNPDDMKCNVHEKQTADCEECQRLRNKAEKYQTHKHTFTCAKKGKTMTIKANEGHGRLDGFINGPALSNLSVCRFRFPKFPLDKTELIVAMPKETDENIRKMCKADLSKITKYLIRQTNSGDNQESEGFKKLKNLSFWEFLFEVGMFADGKLLEECSDSDKQNAKLRYLNAISAGIQGRAAVILKREVKDLFVNGFNQQIMKLHQANHDIQICIDQYSVAQYICGYLMLSSSACICFLSGS